ncbi:MAG: DnaD domain protein [Wujia sp.]
MKTITISTENSETYSSISNFFIDYYMTEANGEFVKVYLYLVRLLSNNSAVTVAGIADHFNLTENDICRAIKYWISRDVLKLNYDGKGHLSGIVLLPLHAPSIDNKLDTDAVSILHADIEPDKGKSSNVRSFTSPLPVVKTPVAVEQDTELSAPPKPRFTPKDCEEKLRDEDLSDIIYQVETLFGKQISQNDINTILYISDTLGFDVDLFEYLIEYCTTMGKKSCRYMETVAIGWYTDGIKNRQQAKEQASLTSGIAKVVFKALGIRRSYPTNIELAYINTWSKDFGFTTDIISCACEKAILQNPSSANYNYVNAILENWYKNNVKTLADVERLEKTFTLKSQNGKQPSGNISSFANFKQTKLDDQLDEMEQLLLKEVNN